MTTPYNDVADWPTIPDELADEIAGLLFVIGGEVAA